MPKQEYIPVQLINGTRMRVAATMMGGEEDVACWQQIELSGFVANELSAFGVLGRLRRA